MMQHEALATPAILGSALAFEALSQTAAKPIMLKHVVICQLLACRYLFSCEDANAYLTSCSITPATEHATSSVDAIADTGKVPRPVV